MATFSADVQAEIDAGRVWRAKEILAGRVGSARDYDAALFEQYGAILLQTNDLYQAGKYLFLSAERKPEYEAAIALFLSRQRGGWRDAVGRFPNPLKRKQFAEFPPAVAASLEKLGLPGDSSAPFNPPKKRNRVRDLGLLAGCIVIGLLLLVGVSEIVHYVVSSIFR